MEVNYQGTFRNAAMEAQVRVWAEELDSVYDRIARCDVVVQALAGVHRPDRKVRVRLAIAVPGGEIVVTRDPAPGPIQEDPYEAVRDSFQAARRRLEEYVWRNLRDDLIGPESPAQIG